MKKLLVILAATLSLALALGCTPNAVTETRTLPVTITAPNPTLDTLNARVSTIDSRLQTAESRLQSLSGADAGFISDIATLKTDLSAAKTELASVKADVNTLKSQPASTAQPWLTGLDSLQTQINTLKAGATALANNDLSLQGKIDALTTRVSAIETKLTAIEADIASLKTKITALQSSLDSMDGSLDDVIERLLVLESGGDVAGIKAHLESITRSGSSASNRTFKINGKIDSTGTYYLALTVYGLTLEDFAEWDDDDLTTSNCYVQDILLRSYLNPAGETITVYTFILSREDDGGTFTAGNAFSISIKQQTDAYLPYATLEVAVHYN